MRDTYRRYLMTLSLGAAIALLPQVQSASANPKPAPGANAQSALRPEAAQKPSQRPSQSAAAPSQAAPGIFQLLPRRHVSQQVSQTDGNSAPLTPTTSSPAGTSGSPTMGDVVPSGQQTTPAPGAATSGEAATSGAGSASPSGQPTTPASGSETPEAATPSGAGNASPQGNPSDPSLPLNGPETPSLPSAPGTASPAAPTTGSAVTPPDYLNPQANPLLLPTQPEEVRIVGTQPITLEEAIELAYRNNESLQVSRLQLERSQAALREAQAALYPTVGVTAGLNAQNGQSTNVTQTGQIVSQSQINTTLSGQVQVNYDLYTGGRREATIRAAEEQVRLSELEVERQQSQLRLDTTNEYYTAQQYVEEIRIAQAFLTEAERNLQDATLREQVGVGTRFDTLRAQVQVANARQQLVQAQSNERTAQRTLARRLNVPPSLNVSTAPVSVAGTWPLSLEDSIVLAFQNRAELEQQLVQRSISEQQRQIALSTYIPQVGLVASYNVQNTLNQSRGFTDNFSLGAQVRWNLFDGGAGSAQAEQRERDIEIAESQFADARNGVRLEVEQAYFNLTSNQENIGTAQLAVTQAQEALQLAQLRFDAGVGTQSDVLSATSELVQAQGNLVQAILGYNRSLASLERAVSNLPEPAGPSASGASTQKSS